MLSINMISSEIWVPRARHKSKLESAKMSFLRFLTEIARRDRVRQRADGGIRTELE